MQSFSIRSRWHVLVCVWESLQWILISIWSVATLDACVACPVIISHTIEADIYYRPTYITHTRHVRAFFWLLVVGYNEINDDFYNMAYSWYKIKWYEWMNECMNDLLDDKRTSNRTRRSQGRTLTHTHKILVNYWLAIGIKQHIQTQQAPTIDYKHLIGTDNN